MEARVVFSARRQSMHDAVARECRTTRASVGLFDATTLGKIEVVGPDAAIFLERMYANAFQKLEVGRCRYGLLLSEAGFLMDDGVIARLKPDRFHVTTTTGGPRASSPIWRIIFRPSLPISGSGSPRPPSNGRPSRCRDHARERQSHVLLRASILPATPFRI